MTRALKKVLTASISAFLAAGLILVTIVLPAEYGWDPLGSGEALGLLGLAADATSPLVNQSSPWQEDEITFELAPFESIEYKYRLNEGATILYSWEAPAEVLFNMHSEPEGSAPGYAVSFALSRSAASNGSYLAPFTGIHGWYWQNRTQQTLSIHLKTAGYYSYALEMRDSGTSRYEFQP